MITRTGFWNGERSHSSQHLFIFSSWHRNGFLYYAAKTQVIRYIMEKEPSLSPQYYIDAGSSGKSNYKAFAIGWAGGNPPLSSDDNKVSSGPR
jgi:hypothetical protein